MDSMRNFPAHAPDQTGRAADRLHALRSPKHQRSVPLPAQGGEDNERLSALVDQTDKLASDPKAIRRLQREGHLAHHVEHRTSKYLK
jgi:uncharacterized protein YciW